MHRVLTQTARFLILTTSLLARASPMLPRIPARLVLRVALWLIPTS